MGAVAEFLLRVVGLVGVFFMIAGFGRPKHHEPYKTRTEVPHPLDVEPRKKPEPNTTDLVRRSARLVQDSVNERRAV